MQIWIQFKHSKSFCQLMQWFEIKHNDHFVFSLVRINQSGVLYAERFRKIVFVCVWCQPNQAAAAAVARERAKNCVFIVWKLSKSECMRWWVFNVKLLIMGCCCCCCCMCYYCYAYKQMIIVEPNAHTFMTNAPNNKMQMRECVIMNITKQWPKLVEQATLRTPPSQKPIKTT